MKKLSLLLLTSMFVAGCDAQTNSDSWPLYQPEQAYEIDAWGTNPGILEFTPKGNPDYFCILAARGGVNRLKSIFCMPKKKSEE